ncbi:cysteine proteinase [Dichomitus squalens]|uniref:Cysteine proteinase n=1 Tax=Dichomitus squalens TaxID=114155 RepID=A0A4Q9MSZ1_9APHY|nr:cysteine proteinase [Dichomitus squalens]
MIRHKSKPTPREIYLEKKRREEEEKDASLPPGLVNHGNTCFMNSTLQGLIATRPLHDLVHFQSVPASLQPAEGPSILARRSPQLTNGHGIGGADELAWTEGMPLGDIFTTIMRKAWDIQDAKRRETMSPKEILTTIGRKYDQYLDFRQQDAHEFLRHMLDAMRMEELDVIKKRQPPPSSTKRKRARGGSEPTSTPPSLPSPALSQSDPPAQAHIPGIPSTPPQLPQQTPDLDRPLPPVPNGGEKLESFVDMLFGGQLASILVCEKCKKVSVTYEDFNDLSLSIKPEDYVNKHHRKRDRIKRIARKLRIRPPAAYGSGSANDSAGSSAKARASSVPTSPVRRSSELALHEEEPPTSVDPRRRSFDHPGEDERRDAVARLVSTVSAPSGLDSAIAEDDETDAAEREKETELERAEETDAFETEGGTDWTHVGADGPGWGAGAGSEEKPKDKQGKEKDDAWGKIARRISVSMKLGGREKDREKDKDKDSRPSSRASERGRKPDIKDAFRVKRSETRSPRMTSLAPGASAHEPAPEAADASEVAKRATSPTPNSPRISSPLRPPYSRRSSANPFARSNHEPPIKSRAVSVDPKMSEEDMAYLQRILADVHPVTGNPLSILQTAFSGNGPVSAGQVGNTAALATQVLWAKLGHLPGIEECLRMFTAVEILDGENMVGCHRCWKIANGLYIPPLRSKDGFDADSDTESDESSGDDSSDQSADKAPISVNPARSATEPSRSETEDSGVLSSPDLSSGRVSPASTSLVSTVVTQAQSRPGDTASVSSAPTTITVPPSESSTSMLHARKDSLLSPQPSTYGGLPIPQISTTEPDTPDGGILGPALSRDSWTQTWPSTRAVVGMSLSDDSLLTPKRRRQRRALRKDGADDSGSSSDDDFDDSASDTSAPSSASESSASPFVSPRSSVEKLTDPNPPSELPSPKPAHRVQDKKVPRSKQVVPRRMYKRYLISTPPPILVIHLKRFQQTNKSHAMSFSGGFKKLDEFVSFPEYLDLAPFLVPKREDFVGKAGKGKIKQQEKCMYRLYAVVVHIGNMLGGHYIAYTALPNSVPPPGPTTPSSESDKPVLPASGSSDSHASQTSETQRPTRKWAYISDSTVKLTTLEEVLKAKAYICMYERV